jgi:3-deoxy-manno-octulosonate cytidylyltransferase (CMP-KDO synthetase)
MNSVVIIPARLQSTRLPRKVILDICGKSMIQRVYESSQKAKNIDGVYIATDSKEIVDICKKFTDNIIMTSPDCESGTDRLAEASLNIECKNIINVQGDEPLMDSELIDKLALLLDNDNTSMVSAMHKIEDAKELINPNAVKVVVDKNSDAIYFSRSIISYPREDIKSIESDNKLPQNIDFYKHIGIYGYKKEFLKIFSKLEPTKLERLEKLEQLRVIENGYKIRMLKTDYQSIGVDTKEDLQRVESIIKGL